MKKIVFIYDLYYDFVNNRITIGGIQTYLSDLIKICLNLNYEVKLFQMGSFHDVTTLDGLTIEQIQVKPRHYDDFYKFVLSSIDKDVVVLFGTETIVPKDLKGHKAIGIQHGIYWDKPVIGSKSLLRMYLSKAYRNYKIIQHIRSLTSLVCVDYNYVNWLRAETDNVSTKLHIIPNYTKIAPIYEKPKDKVNIIFARRLFDYRGTRVFTSAAKRILSEYVNINVTVAGSGPDEEYMKNELGSYSNVEFITYKSSDSLQIHADKHIAVIPTIGSEGTSLSLLEAMSAQCAVIASNVGGMTNIILDNYNGLMVNAGDAEDLYLAIKRLLDNIDDRRRLSLKAYETVKLAFSYERWAEKWTQVLNSVE